MRVRFGYVAIALEVQNASPNKTITVQQLQKLPEDVHWLKLRQLAEVNLANQLRVLRYNLAHDIHVFRFTSKFVPLATHELAKGWRYDRELKAEFEEIGEFVKAHGFRVSFHPDHFVNINSPKPDIVESSIHILKHHYIQARAMGLDERTKFNIHVGGAYANKSAALERFIENWMNIPAVLQNRITVENDDRTFTARETLYIAEKVGIPMVLDVHHHRCNHEEDTQLEPLLPNIFATWAGTGIPPKVHISSPRGTSSSSEFRSHADYVDIEDVLPFLEMARNYTDSLDVMLEAKAKDRALHTLMQQLEADARVTVVNQASIDV